MRRTIDLHVHSDCSDGTDSPEALPRLAAAQGIAAFALTDHDTTAGLKRARAACAGYPGVLFVPGVELSANHPGRMHILGLFIRETAEFTAFLHGLEQARRTRGRKIAAALESQGIQLDGSLLPNLDRVSVTRAHFARALVDMGVCAGMDDAFDRYLSKGRPAYIPQARPEPGACIAMIHQAGGMAVLAHPHTVKLPEGGSLESLLGGLCEQGLDGMECYYPGYDASHTRRLLDLCGRFGLCVSGGSDYHGANKPNRMGLTGAGRVPFCVYEALLQKNEGNEKMQ